MTWSFSESRLFRNCQRQWYFKTRVANANAKKDPLRREAYLLSKLQSIAAWRGNVVDHVISQRVVPALKNRWNLNSAKILEYAKTVFDQQLQFALQYRVHESKTLPADAGDVFAAFYEVEYGQGVSGMEISQAWSDVEGALLNLFEMRDLLATLSSANNLIPQRALTFSHFKTTVRAVPDLIAFFDDSAPLIVDWKVHAFGTRDYRLQLACYAIALTRCKRQKDFPESISQYQATDIRLLEVQLLTKQQRKYSLSDQDVEEVDGFIAETSLLMMLALGDGHDEQLSPFDFPTTMFPETCQRCSFRSLCWKEATPWNLKQTSFL